MQAINDLNNFNERFQKKLMALPFPTTKLWSAWYGYAHEALHYNSLMGLGIQAEDWERLHNACLTKGELTLYEFAVLNNNLQLRTPKELTLSIGEYSRLMRNADALVNQWQTLTADVRAALEAEIAEETKSKIMAAAEKKGRSLAAEA